MAVNCKAVPAKRVGFVGVTAIESSEAEHIVSCAPDDLIAVREALEKRFGPSQSARLVWRAKSAIGVDGDIAQALFKLLETLEDSDDVQNVYANFEVGDEVLARLSA